MNEVVNGVIGARDVELAVIPRGTGWDFVRTFDIPRDLDAPSMSRYREQSARSMRASSAIERGAGGRGRAHFANVASAGIWGAIAQRANESSKALGGKVSYSLGHPRRVLRVAGRRDARRSATTRTGRMIDAMICNGRFLGGGMMMCPDASPMTASSTCC